MPVDFEDIVPELSGNFSKNTLMGFHLDALSQEILRAIDGKATIRRMIEKTGATTADIEKSLKLLKAGGLIKFTSDYRMIEQPEPVSGEDARTAVEKAGTRIAGDSASVTPTRTPNMDVSGFHLDLSSRKILECVDGVRNVAQISKMADVDLAATINTLNLLKGARVVKYPDGIGQLSVPAPEPAEAPEEVRESEEIRAPEEIMEPEENTQVRRIKSSFPAPADSMDTSGFYFDPLSRKILDMIDGETTLGEIVKKTGASLADVEKTLKLLSDGRLVNWSPDQQTAKPRSSMPPFSGGRAGGAPGAHPAESASADSYSKLSTEELEGNLEDKNIESLVDEADMASLTGSIRCARGNETVTFHFEDGEPKGVDTTSPLYSDFGAMLHRAGFIDTEMLKRFRTEFAKDSDSVQALRRAGIEDPKRMAQLLVWRGETLFREVLGWIDGTYLITQGAPIPEKTARCRLKFITSGSSKSSGWRKGHLTDEQVGFFTEKRALYMVPTKRAAKMATKMGLDDTEKRYVKNVLEAAPLQLSKAMSISTLMKASTRKILLYLIDNGAFELQETNPEEEPPIPLDDLERYQKKLDYEDHFSVLNAHAVSILEEIRERYERRVREFESSRYPDAEPQHMESLDKIRKRIEKAWSVLKEDASRQEYRREVYTKFQLDNFFSLQMEKAEAALSLRQSPREALPLAQSAWDLRPGHVVVKNMLVQCLTELGRKSEISDYTAKASADSGDKKKKMKK